MAPHGALPRPELEGIVVDNEHANGTGALDRVS